MMARRNISKEAKLGEVLAEVSLADLGTQFKKTFYGMGCLIVYFAVIGGITSGASQFHIGITVPNIVWIAFCVFVFVAIGTGETSWHEWSFRFFFPKLKFFGWIVLTAYLSGIIEAFRYVKIPNEPLLSFAALVAIYVVLIAPGILFVGLLDLGHARLMEKREAEAAGE